MLEDHEAAIKSKADGKAALKIKQSQREAVRGDLARSMLNKVLIRGGGSSSSTPAEMSDAATPAEEEVAVIGEETDEITIVRANK